MNIRVHARCSKINNCYIGSPTLRDKDNKRFIIVRQTINICATNMWRENYNKSELTRLSLRSRNIAS
jgi:hypothetical protein